MGPLQYVSYGLVNTVFEVEVWSMLFLIRKIIALLKFPVTKATNTLAYVIEIVVDEEEKERVLYTPAPEFPFRRGPRQVLRRRGLARPQVLAQKGHHLQVKDPFLSLTDPICLLGQSDGRIRKFGLIVSM